MSLAGFNRSSSVSKSWIMMLWRDRTELQSHLSVLSSPWQSTRYLIFWRNIQPSVVKTLKDPELLLVFPNPAHQAGDRCVVEESLAAFWLGGERGSLERDFLAWLDLLLNKGSQSRLCSPNWLLLPFSFLSPVRPGWV